MELWIRSQDKECLVKISNIQYVLRKETNCGISTEYHYIGTYYDNLKILGTYKTKERALEVLNEIQNMLYAGLKATNNNQLAGTTSIVYQMPKK
jgi:hypothetical protein